MIDNKTGKYYVYRLLHRPSGKYFQELMCSTYRAEELRVSLSKDGSRIFTSASQLGKLWGRVETLRSQMNKADDLSSPNTPQANNSLAQIHKKAAEVLEIMDSMEIEISELFTAPNPEIEEKLRMEAIKEQASNALQSAFPTIFEGSSRNHMELFNGFLSWEKLKDKEQWTNIVSLEKVDGRSSRTIVDKLDELGIKTHIFDIENHPRIMAINDEDLNLIKLTSKNIIRNLVNIEEALKLKAEIFARFGLNT